MEVCSLKIPLFLGKDIIQMVFFILNILECLLLSRQKWQGSLVDKCKSWKAKNLITDFYLLVSIRTYFGNANFFGGPSASCLKTSSKLKFQEEQNSDSMMVFISDVWLDQVQVFYFNIYYSFPLAKYLFWLNCKVLEKLRVLFSGYCEVPPIAFVLMGNFLSADSQGTTSHRELRKLFKALAEMIREFPNLLENSRFIFVPGPSDLGFSNIIPRPPLPDCIRIDFEQRIPNSSFTTNPCRINCGTKEIVILREDILSKMLRNAIHFPESDDIPQQVC